MKPRCLLVLVFACVSPVLAQEPSSEPVVIDYDTARLSRIATAVRTDDDMRIDGQLDEPAWELAPAIGNFLQRRPRNGQPMTEVTYDSAQFNIPMDDALFRLAQ